MARDAKFLQRTKDIIAGRAGYRCSYPGCDLTTIGPNPKTDEEDNTGMACHIFAASDNGPRGTGGLSPEEREHHNNGIWMCYKHGKLIDSKDGAGFTAFELQRWKALHEARIGHEHHGLPLPFGWLTGIEITTSPLFTPGTKIEFGKVTLLVGNNATGKTAVCNWITTATGDFSHLGRWRFRHHELDQLDYLVRHSAPVAIDCRVIVTPHDVIMSVNNLPSPGLGHCLKVVYVTQPVKPGEAIDSVEELARICNVHRTRLLQALSLMMSLELPYVKGYALKFDEDPSDPDDEEYERVRSPDFQRTLHQMGLEHLQGLAFQIGDHTEPMPFYNLSDRELVIAILSSGIALAQLEAVHTPTVLIIDLGNVLPDPILNEYARLLTKARFQFQTILVSSIDRPKVDWTGWSIARFVGEAPKVTISQQIIKPA